ncbi:MAG: MFS transporter [Coriobacteriales bacterium]|nr:MFS transporter [Coriobacteriales bacterium]
MEQDDSIKPLWTRDFTIITLGSVISMFGNAMSGFAMSLMVLDISESTLLYAVYIAMYTLPQLFMPIISGAVLDRFSRKKTIYTLDFISSFLYIFMACVLATGWFSFPLFAIYCFILGSIQSSYMVAYESFYPLLISEGNFQKAYSIASVLETVSAIMIPLSAFLYNIIGLAPLLAINGMCFFIAAVMETRIGAEEHYIETQKETELEGSHPVAQILNDSKEGFRYLASEKGLLAIALYFVFSAICNGVSSVVTLPYFKNTFPNGEYWFMFVMAFAILGRAIGGLIHYRIKIPAQYRYTIALTVYIVISICEGTYLFLSFPLMALLCFITGIGGVTSYTIRISATQSYVPDEKKGRFNGAFNMLSTLGALIGEFAAGTLTVILPERIVLLCAMMLCAVAAVVIIGGGKQYVSAIYNRIR